MTDFLEALWGSLDGDHAAYLWTGQDKRSHWYSWPSDLPQAALQAQELADPAAPGGGKDVYFSVGLGPRKLSAGQRTGMADVTAIAGIWVDIDYRNENHKKQNLPPTIDDAVRLAMDMPVPPTAIISTGHGIAAWWLLKEPWEFTVPGERGEAAWMVEQWQRAVRSRASEQGWDVDATHDLARVMRVPGTRNFKDPTNVKDVVLLEEYYDTRRYARTDLELWTMSTDPTLREVVTPADLASDWKPRAAGALVNNDRFIALMESDEMFRQSWNHERNFQDQSLSSYDLSLASLAAGAGWSDEEIADLIAEHRRIAGDLSKGARKDYLARTIAVARRRGDTEAAVSAIMAGDTTALTSGDNAEKARGIWGRLGVESVVAWYKVLGDPLEFVLVTPGGETRMSEEVFGTFTSIQRRLTTNLGVSLKGIRGQTGWWGAASALTRVAEVRGEPLDPVAQVWGWIESYVAEGGLEETEVEHRRERLDRDGAIRVTDPRTGTLIVVKGAAFLRFIQANEAEDKLTKGELARLWLRAGGRVNIQVATVRADGTRGNLKVWAIPEQAE